MDSSWEEAIDRELDKMRLLQHIFDAGGSHTVRDVINTGIVTNADDAIALMSRLVDAGDAHWTAQNGTQAVRAARSTSIG